MCWLLTRKLVILNINRIEMKENKRNIVVVEGCPLRTVMDRFGDKWSILVIRTLGEEGTLRFNELEKSIEDISQRMLSKTLKSLELCGLINRKVHAEVPPRVEYFLTELGHSLLPIIDSLVEWSTNHLDEINIACNTPKN